MPKHIHFIGICGVAMSALALAFKRNSPAKDGVNWKVTGSDVGFYPPVSTHLKDAGVDYYAGWHPEKMVADGTPDLVVVGNVASSANPEWLYVQEHKLNYKSYPEVIAEYFVKQNSIVCAGTYGKTTTSALMTWILKEAGFDPSYMFGGLSQNNIPAADFNENSWSVMEGDEYKASKWDNRAKFFYYSPTHLLLTAAVWDHADVYPTEEEYFEAFRKLIGMIPENGLKVVSEQALAVILNEVKRNEESPSLQNQLGTPARGSFANAQDDKVITYGKSSENDYIYSNITQSKNGIEFDITHNGKTYRLTSPCLGEYMADNITACFAMAHEIGIAPEKIIAAVKSFAGMKRRLEKRLEGDITVFDDIAHSPVKAKSTLETLRATYPDAKIFAIFEPNTGNRRPQARPWYDNAFATANEVIIPKLTKVKIDPHEEPPLEGNELAEVISKTQLNTRYIEDDQELLNYVQQITQAGDVIVFMGSHGFRGMIESLVANLSKSQS